MEFRRCVCSTPPNHPKFVRPQHPASPPQCPAKPPAWPPASPWASVRPPRPWTCRQAARACKRPVSASASNAGQAIDYLVLNRHKTGVPTRFKLWPVTKKLLAQHTNKSGLAFTDENGQNLYI